MLKNKFKIITVLTIAFLILTLPVVKAVEVNTNLIDGSTTESNDPYAIQPISAQDRNTS